MHPHREQFRVPGLAGVKCREGVRYRGDKGQSDAARAVSYTHLDVYKRQVDDPVRAAGAVVRLVGGELSLIHI